MLKSVIVIASFVILNVSGRPQTDRELAHATRLQEQVYYNLDEAPDLIKYEQPSHLDNAREEHEGYGSKIDSIYDGFQKKTTDIFNAKPVVDGIKESEKYGNAGDHLAGLQSALTGALSVVSNLLNTVVDAPGNLVQGVVKSTNNLLNNVGGKIVGLQK